MANTTTSPKGKDENRTNAPTMEKAKDMASQVMDKTKDVASQVVDKTKEAASSVGDMVSNAASNVGKSAENLTSNAGTGLRHLGESLAQKAPHEGMLGDASQAVAKTIKEGGRYLEEAGLSGMADDLTGLIKRNPVPAVLIGLGVGFLIGRALRS
jgi:hypothetical protein